MEESNDKEIQKQQDITLMQMKQVISKQLESLRVRRIGLFHS